MPLFPPTSGAYIKGTLNSLQAQITALATTQNQYVLDQNGTQRLARYSGMGVSFRFMKRFHRSVEWQYG
jgi:hypothetical protein